MKDITQMSSGKLASCGHLVWSGDRCATMTCPNYVNKQQSAKTKTRKVKG